MNLLIFIKIAFLITITAVQCYASEDIGKIVALKGKAIIGREKKTIEAKLKDGILLIDTINTKESSKTKLLFIDDSILTVGENSSVAVKDFVYNKEDRGKAIFNLIDGKMRAVVGKTNFEVHTPTLIAAARGTVIFFETGEKEGQKYTTVICLEGNVDIRSIDPTISGDVKLTPGMMVTVKQKEALPSAVEAGKAVTAKQNLTDQKRDESDKLRAKIMANKILKNEPIRAKTPVTINIGY